VNARRAPRGALRTGLAVWLVGCTQQQSLESHYPTAAVKRADHVILDTHDIEQIDGYHNLGIVSGSSCDDQAGAEKMIRLEAAKVGANKVVHLQCWAAGPLSGCFSQTYRCKGKAIAIEEGGARSGPDDAMPTSN
jgi:hypothetical protein